MGKFGFLKTTALSDLSAGRRIEAICGLVLMIGSSITMLGWLTQQPKMVQLYAGLVAMVFNTGLLFFISSVILMIGRSALRKALSIFVGAFAATSFLQYIVNVDFGIDQLFVHAWLSDPNPYPGRMAPQTAIGFVISASAFFLLEFPYHRIRNLIIHVAGLVLSIVGILHMIGYSVRLELLYSWYSYTRMAVQTAAAFTILAIGIWLRWYRTNQRLGLGMQREERRVNVIGIALIVLVATTAGASGFVTLAKQTENIALNGIENAVRSYVKTLAGQVEERKNDAEIILNRPRLNSFIKDRGAAFGPADGETVAALLKSFLLGDIEGITVKANDGQVVTTVGHMLDRATLAIALDKESQLLWHDAATLRITRSIVIDGVTYGTEIVDTRLTAVPRLIADSAHLGGTGDLRICSATSELEMQCLPTRRYSDVEVHAPRIQHGNPMPASLAANGQTGSFIFRDFHNHQAAGAYAPVPGTSLGIALFQDTDDLYAPIRENLQITIVILALVVIGAIILLRWQIAPLMRAVVTARAEADNNANRVAAVMNNIPEGIITVNTQGHIVSFNAAIKQLFGYSDAELEGANIKLLMPSGSHAAHDAGFSRYLQTRQPKLIGGGSVELAARRKDGSEFPIELTLTEMQINGDRCFVGIMHDITKRREVDRIKSEFVSVVSHELRTPLTSIRGSLGLINSGLIGVLPEKAQHMIEIAYRNTDRLAHLINDILDMERIEAGRMQFEMDVLPLKPLIEEALEVNIGYAQAHNVRFIITAPIPDIRVRIDPHRLLQVMANLLSNAAKFSLPNTDVEISVIATHSHCRVSIRDHGPGVPEDFHSKIFGKFCQANSTDERSKTGTGLGLTISKAIIEEFAGTISYDSVLNEGATFYFELPLAEADEYRESNAA